MLKKGWVILMKPKDGAKRDEQAKDFIRSISRFITHLDAHNMVEELLPVEFGGLLSNHPRGVRLPIKTFSWGASCPASGATIIVYGNPAPGYNELRCHKAIGNPFKLKEVQEKVNKTIAALQEDGIPCICAVLNSRYWNFTCPSKMVSIKKVRGKDEILLTFNNEGAALLRQQVVHINGGTVGTEDILDRIRKKYKRVK